LIHDGGTVPPGEINKSERDDTKRDCGGRVSKLGHKKYANEGLKIGHGNSTKMGGGIRVNEDRAGIRLTSHRKIDQEYIQ